MAKCVGALVFLAIGGALASCGMSDDTVPNLVAVSAPADFRSCIQLIDAIKASIKRQEQLQELDRKAGSGVGSVIAATTYRPAYVMERTNEIKTRRTAREKVCQLPATLPPLDRR